MEDALFSELLESVHEALEHSQGKRHLKTTVLPPPPRPMDAQDVRDLRSRLDASQAVFASYLNVSTKLVQAWEAGRRRPDGAALRLLRLAEKAPELLLTGTRATKLGPRNASPKRGGRSPRRRSSRSGSG